MGSLRQTSFFSFEEWIHDTEWDDRLQAILDAVPLGPALSALPQPARTGRPETHDRALMLRAYVAKAVEQIPTTEALRARLRRDPVFRWIVGYRGKSDIPSAATFSRIFDQISQCTSLQAVHAQQVETARARQIVSTDEAAYDASDVPAYEKTRRHADAQDPERASWGLKTGPKGQKYRWFGYKLHLAVAAGSLFPLAALTTTAKMHDVNMARPLVTMTTDRDMGQQTAIFDAGYDQATLYQDLQAQGLVPIIPLNRHGGEAPEGRDDLGRPTCSMGYTLTLAGYDATMATQKFRCPHATGHVDCPMGMAWCSSSNYGYVQKIAIADDPREVGRIVRGTAAWDALYELRTSVERAFSYLKEQLNLRTVRVRGRRKVHTHNLFAVIALAAAVLAATV
ncbi:transposase [Sulfobacillus harzensis]|uniref:Transposase n=1 Tax=Sulfobacillus harzensis TaxID=2729629 RepID=A0A7Y0L899_9FIRM|nr:transposase [Sulfobacillus harzensis]NMP25139.1 transposase [Sulfobacillus harzensis]